MLKFKPARKYEAKQIAKMFSMINRKIPKKRVISYIKDRKVYVLKDKKRIKAAVCFSIYSILGIFSFMYIHKLAVSPEMYGQGIGTFLLARIKLLGIKMGIPAFVLYSIKKAKGFYEKNNLRRFWRFFWWKKEA